MKSLMVFQTDFTYKEGAVCAMYGVVKSVDRELEILDGTHEIPQYDTWSASYRLYQSMKFWPKDTVFVSVVDPGVGTWRKASVARTSDGYYVVTPDNGSLTHLKKLVGIDEIREIDESINRLKGKGTEEVAIFHGRDVFAYCGARLAAGIISFVEVGPSYPVDEIVEHEIFKPIISPNLVKGIIEIPDPNFGNSWTNVSLKEFKSAGFDYGDMIDVVIKNKNQIVFEKRILFHQSFGFAKKGQPMIYNNELMNIAFAVNQGSFFEIYGIGYGSDWSVEFSRGK
jgi:S-adenosylmethionine hydrolase